MTVEALGRAADLYRRTALTRSAVALLIANAIPLIGVLFFGWSLMTILVLYWIENGIVGFWNVPRLLLAQGSLMPRETLERQLAAQDARPPADTPERQYARDQLAMLTRLGRTGVPGIGRAGLAAFFLVHYGIFWFVHGIFVFSLPTFGAFGAAGSVGSSEPCFEGTLPPGGLPGFPGLEPCASGGFGDVLWGSVAIAAVALAISHGVSFLFNYVWRGEYRTASPAQQMTAPYGRVVVLHVTILLGAFAIAFIGAPVGALVVFVVLKTLFDLGLHLREHRAAAARLAAATPELP